MIARWWQVRGPQSCVWAPHNGSRTSQRILTFLLGVRLGSTESACGHRAVLPRPVPGPDGRRSSPRANQDECVTQQVKTTPRDLHRAFGVPTLAAKFLSEPRYDDPMRNVALLRGINVGGRVIHMTELRALFSDLGFGGVTTVLQTGNVIFRSEDPLESLMQTIEVGLRERFGYAIHVWEFRLEELRGIVATSPFDGSDSRVHSYVVFFERGLERELLAEARDVDNDFERLELGNGVIYWQVPKGSTLRSGFAKYLTSARYRDFHTNRNINTLPKIIA